MFGFKSLADGKLERVQREAKKMGPGCGGKGRNCSSMVLLLEKKTILKTRKNAQVPENPPTKKRKIAEPKASQKNFEGDAQVAGNPPIKKNKNPEPKTT